MEAEVRRGGGASADGSVRTGRRFGGQELILLLGWAFLCVLCASAVSAFPQAPATSEPPRYEGSLAEGLAEIEALTAKGETARALELCEALLAPTRFTRWRRELEREDSKVLLPLVELADPLFESLGLNGYPEPLRAEVHYAEGLVQRAAEAREEAGEAFARAVAIAGPGELRLASMYNRALGPLEEGEAWRAQIPEISGQPAAAPPAQPPAAPMGGAPQAQEEPPDPLEEARKAYERARERLVERLKADWRDADTRANVELVQRRLKELERLERQREEQQEEQQDEQQENEEQQQQDQPDEQQGGEPEEQQDERQEGEEPQQEPNEPEAPEEQEDEGEPQEEPQPEEGQDEEPPTPQDIQPQPAEPEEVYLTREEMQRLLDTLRRHEEEGEMVRERVRTQRQRRVERDW